MMKYMMRRLALLALVAAAPGTLYAQVPVPMPATTSAAPAPADTTKQAAAPALPGPAIQKIATASAVSTEPLGTITDVRELPNGNVLVNDGAKRRLLMMDSSMKLVSVVLDSLTNVTNSYGARPGTLLRFPGDSTLFIDQASLAMLVINPAGVLTRVRSVWRVQDLYMLSTPSYYGYPGFDAKGRIVYRIPAQVSPAVMAAAMNSDIPFYPPPPDSAFIVAFNLETRKQDTLGSIRIPKQEYRFRMTPEGWYTSDQVINPLPRLDEWAVLPDHRIAFVRGQDYRVEYLNPDGTMTSSEKLPYDWQRLDDAAKQMFVDSVKKLQEIAAETQFVTSTIRWMNMYNGKYPVNFHVPDGYVVPNGFPKDWFLPKGVTFPEKYVYACPAGEKPPAGPATAPAPGAAPAPPPCTPAPVVMNGGMAPPPPTIRPVVMVDAKELPDYRPPMSTGAVRADEDNDLWIKFVQQKNIPGGPVYDIVDPKGVLVNRIQLPSGYTIAGFGKGKVVYLSMRDAKGVHLARVQLK